jgi:hypothetical protein
VQQLTANITATANKQLTAMKQQNNSNSKQQ